MYFTLFVMLRIYWASQIGGLLTSLVLKNAQPVYLQTLLLNYFFYVLLLRLQWYQFQNVSLYLQFSYHLFSNLSLLISVLYFECFFRSVFQLAGSFSRYVWPALRYNICLWKPFSSLLLLLLLLVKVRFFKNFYLAHIKLLCHIL